MDEFFMELLERPEATYDCAVDLNGRPAVNLFVRWLFDGELEKLKEHFSVGRIAPFCHPEESEHYVLKVHLTYKGKEPWDRANDA